MDITKSVRALAALAQESRLNAFRLLVREGLDGLAAGEIARRLDVPHNTLSSHLAILVNAVIASTKSSATGDALKIRRSARPVIRLLRVTALPTTSPKRWVIHAGPISSTASNSSTSMQASTRISRATPASSTSSPGSPAANPTSRVVSARRSMGLHFGW